MPYELGADGSNGRIDCIHLVYEVLDRLGIEVPQFDKGWYEAGRWPVTRAILKWGKRVVGPHYDGDVVLLRQQTWAFGVTWQSGILYCNRRLGKVAWSSARNFTDFHCFRSKNKSSS